jgi:hypothetical protein
MEVDEERRDVGDGCGTRGKGGGRMEVDEERRDVGDGCGEERETSRMGF